MKLRPAALLAAFLLVPRPGVPDEPPPKVAGVDVPAPKRLKSIAPHYPPEAQAVGMRGIVILELVVGPDGKVVSARVTRSVPPFDEAALTAVRQWEYEITKVDGKPVSVVLTVPIEFKMRMPDMTRDEGIPELRQGVAPAFPAGAEAETAMVTAEVTLDPDGHVAEAHIKSGDSPWAEAVIQALRTWRFTPLDGQSAIAFEVRAQFASGGRGGPRVDLRLTGPRHLEAAPTAAASPVPSPAPATGEPTNAPLPAAAANLPPSSLPTPAPVASPQPSPTPATAPSSAASPAPGASAAPAPRPSPVPTPSPPPAQPRPAAPPEELIHNPAGGAPASPRPPSLAPAPGMPAAPVPGPSATPPPPTPGISAVRDVTLAVGVPDLMRGRRPVAPPLARMQGISGTVEVRFAVDAAGSATVREVTGPDQLKEAARQTVASWSFRRTTPERLFLAAIFTYKGDTAAAAVRAQE